MDADSRAGTFETRDLGTIDGEANLFLVAGDVQRGGKNLPALLGWLGQCLLLVSFVHGNDFHPLRTAAPSAPPDTFAGEDEFMGRFRRPERDGFDANGVVFKTPGQAGPARANGNR